MSIRRIEEQTIAVDEEQDQLESMAEPIGAIGASVPTLAGRLQAAYIWIDSLYQTDGTFGYLKEYPSFPVWQYIIDTKQYKFSGFYRPGMPLGVVSPATELQIDYVRPTEDASWLYFLDRQSGPTLYLRRQYLSTAIKHSITLVKYGEDPSPFTRVPYFRSDLYLGNSLVFSNIGRNTTLGISKTISSTAKGLPSHRYTVRHAARLGEFIYRIWGMTSKADKLANLRASYGFSYDIYDPLFGASRELEDDHFMFTTEAYRDCDIYAQLPVGKSPNRYPYHSKVCFDTTAYLFASAREDTLPRMLQAIHILDKYNNPYQEYTMAPQSPAFYFDAQTPLEVASNIWVHDFNGLGIQQPGAPEGVTSGVRTAAFLALATLLGYKYNITQWKGIAGVLYSSLSSGLAPQAGNAPLSYGYIRTRENGLLLRPCYQGAFYNVWIQVGSDISHTSEQSWLQEFFDMWNMPLEEIGPIVSNVEATAAIVQALRIYNYFALNATYPSASASKPYIPCISQPYILYLYLSATNNTVIYQGPTRPIKDAFFAIQDKIEAVWWYDTVAGKWKGWNPTAPDWANELTTLTKGETYIIRANAACNWAYDV